MYRQILRPLLDTHFPSLDHSAGLVGYGSDVLGVDTARSRDHDWGPRALLFVAEPECDAQAPRVREMLRARLPTEFAGYSLHFTAPDRDDNGTRIPAVGVPGEVDSLVEVTSPERFVSQTTGRDTLAAPRLREWLALPEQALIELTAGEIFHDGLDTMMPLRERFGWYPTDVWRYRLAAQWTRISQEEAFVGRCRELGDDLGARIVVARLARDLMRLCFLMELRYAPYSKWLGTLFATLPCAATVGPPLERALGSSDAAAAETALGEAFVAAIPVHNALGLTPAAESALRDYFDRPYPVVWGTRFVAPLMAGIEHEGLRSLPPQLGAVDQWTDCSGPLRAPEFQRALARVFAPPD